MSGPTINEVLDLINLNPHGLTTYQVSQILSVDVNSTSGKLHRLLQSNKIKKVLNNPVLWLPI